MGANPRLTGRIGSVLPEHLVEPKIIALFCVGTPQDSDGSADTSTLLRAINQLLEAVNHKTIDIVIKSTVPPGTCDKLESACKPNEGNNKAIYVSNPEFLREGHALEDFNNPDRILIGSNYPKKLSIETIYRQNFSNVIRTNGSSAEFSKYYSNSALATMISYSNEMRVFADSFGGIETKAVFAQFQLDRRWSDGSMAGYFWPGIGFGGYCLPKDTRALYSSMVKNGSDARMLSATIATNDSLVEIFARKIIEKFHGMERIVLFGASFKVGSDDVRHSKTTDLISRLQFLCKIPIGVLKDPAANEISKKFDKLELLVESDITNRDGLVVVLKSSRYRKLLNKFDSKQIVNIPLL